MVTRKQYYPQVMYKGHNVGKWSNIMYMDVNGGKRFANSLEEAKQAIENAKKVWGKDTRDVQKCGNIGIEVESVKDDTFTIVATRIRVREVTDWEEVE